MMDVLKYLSNDQSKYDIQLSTTIKPYFDFQHVFTCGHSFGGISAVFCAKHILKQEKVNDYNLCGTFVFEPWFEPKENEILSEQWNSSYLCIIGDKWKRNRILGNTLTMVYKANKNVKHKCLVYLNGFTHNDFCDACTFGPQWLLRNIHSCVQNDSTQNAQDIYCMKCIEFIGQLVPKWKEGIDYDKYVMYSDKHISLEQSDYV